MPPLFRSQGARKNPTGPLVFIMRYGLLRAVAGDVSGGQLIFFAPVCRDFKWILVLLQYSVFY